MKTIPRWGSLFVYCVFAAFATALVFAIIVAGGAVALASHQDATGDQPQTALTVAPAREGGTRFTGMITDSHCRARHMRNSHLSTAECAKECVRTGATYILVDGDRHYILIGGEQSLFKLAGERANIIGTLQGDAILVNSAGALF